MKAEYASPMKDDIWGVRTEDLPSDSGDPLISAIVVSRVMAQAGLTFALGFGSIPLAAIPYFVPYLPVKAFGLVSFGALAMGTLAIGGAYVVLQFVVRPPPEVVATGSQKSALVGLATGGAALGSLGAALGLISAVAVLLHFAAAVQ